MTAAIGATILAISTGVLTAPASAISTVDISRQALVSAGRSCPKVGKLVTASRVLYRCEKWGSAKVWVVRRAPGKPKFEIDYLRTVTARVIRDMATTDCRARDGIAVSGSLLLLSDDFDNLANNAIVPPRASASAYVSRARTLSSFSSRAADNIDYGDESTGYAQYAVVRSEAKPLIAMINRGLGTRYAYISLRSC